eukprot:jgi/Mesen1/6315/ME000325S05451
MRWRYHLFKQLTDGSKKLSLDACRALLTTEMAGISLQARSVGLLQNLSSAGCFCQISDSLPGVSTQSSWTSLHWQALPAVRSYSSGRSPSYIASNSPSEQYFQSSTGFPGSSKGSTSSNYGLSGNKGILLAPGVEAKAGRGHQRQFCATVVAGNREVETEVDVGSQLGDKEPELENTLSPKGGDEEDFHGGLQEIVLPDHLDVEVGSELVRPDGTNLMLPAGASSKVKVAQFIKSSADVSQCPQDGRPEFALVGRSNVGKSSLINMLVNRRDLAETSKRPGKTQLINHFLINHKWYIVDLPGYGFAKAPVAVRTGWNDFTKDYFLKRDNLVAVMLLVDASIPPQQIDLECVDWLGRNEIPVTLVFTKCDKKKKKKNGGVPVEENIEAFEAAISHIYSEPPPWVMTSSATKMGRDNLLLHMAQLREVWKN